MPVPSYRDHFGSMPVRVICVCVFVIGYGFVDYESERSAEVALKTLQSNGVQAQMAKVCPKTADALLYVND